MSIIFFDRPAALFEEALPLGNGKLGAMIYGGVEEERISVNYDELWTGYPRDDNKDAYESFIRARGLALSGKAKEAEELIEKETCSPSVQSYQPAGYFLIKRNAKEFGEYRRALDLGEAKAEVSYKSGTDRFKNTYITSALYDCLAVSFVSDGRFCLEISFVCPLKHTSGCENGVFYTDGECMYDSAQNREADKKRDRDYSDDAAERGIHFRVAAACDTDGEMILGGNGIKIKDASHVVLYAAVESSFAGYNVHRQFSARDEYYLERLM